MFDEAYPLPKDGCRRSAPFVPYLAYTPDDFALSLCFSAVADLTPLANMIFDAEGNLWSGMNWLPGSQSGVNKSIGGGYESSSAPTEPRSRRRSPASPAWALTASAGARP